MRAGPPRAFALILVIGCGLGAAWCGGRTPTSPTNNPPITTTPPVTATPPLDEVPVNQTPISTTPTSPPAGSTWVNVVGDTGWCGSPVMPALARLMETLGGDILFAGDLAYDRGTLDEFRRCFDPAFGRFRTRSWAVPGNHEYMTSGATGFFSYFGDRAGPDLNGYYALRIAGWQVLMLNSNVPMTRGSRQLEFVRQQMQAAPRCTLAVWHHPFDTLRLEMCYPLNGSDLSPEHNPIEAGLGFFVDLKKPNFIGREALARARESGTANRLVPFRMKSKGPPPRPHYSVWREGEKIGEVTSGTLSPSLSEGIGMAYVASAHAKTGSELEIEIRGQRLPAVIEKKPFYKKT